MDKTREAHICDDKTGETKNQTAENRETENSEMPQVGFKDALIERRSAALRFMGAQAASTKWMVLPGSRPVRLSELRGDMCRWPIGDPQHHEDFRFCGCDCHPGDSYCAAHKKMAVAPGKATRAASDAGNPQARLRSRVASHI